MGGGWNVNVDLGLIYDLYLALSGLQRSDSSKPQPSTHPPTRPGFTKTLALEVATKGVTCNAVCPGYVMTELIAKQLEDQARTRGIPKEKVVQEVLLADQPIKRFVTPREVGALVRHLCSEDGAAITGACLSIDGGWTAR